MACTSTALWRLLRVLPAWAGVLLFFSGTVMLTGGGKVAGIIPPTFAVVAGVLLFALWLIIHLVSTDAVKPRGRRRPH